MITLEVACANVDSVLAATDGGADRIELCAALGVGGVTPSLGFVKEAKSITHLPVFVMIRPREGDFLYNNHEKSLMLNDISLCRDAGADGIVFGALDQFGNIDQSFCKEVLGQVGLMKVTFHRAFDLAKDPFESIKHLISLGIHRVLTSGQQPSALQGASLIKELQMNFGSSIAIMAGAGVRSNNVQELLQRTDINEVHLSGKSLVASQMQFRRNSLSMGAQGQDEYALEVTNLEQIRAMRLAIDAI